jgi:hypothetical protein
LLATPIRGLLEFKLHAGMFTPEAFPYCMTSTPRLTLGGEAYGGIADNSGLARSQLQGLAGGMYAVHNGFNLTFAVLGGKYVASPRIGGQVGFSIDFPAIFRRSEPDQSSSETSRNQSTSNIAFHK